MRPEGERSVRSATGVNDGTAPGSSPSACRRRSAPVVRPSPQHLSRGNLARSASRTRKPQRASVAAADAPAGPAPTTATSVVSSPLTDARPSGPFPRPRREHGRAPRRSPPARWGGRSGSRSARGGSGSTRWLARTTSSATMRPIAATSAALGTARRAGRWSASPRASANSALRTGEGAVRLHGPCRSAQAAAWRRAPTSSSRAIQLSHDLPAPSGPPRPRRKMGACFASTPPRAPRTIPVRTFTTRMPPALAGDVAASHARQSSARKPVPAVLPSTRISSPRSP